VYVISVIKSYLNRENVLPIALHQSYYYMMSEIVKPSQNIGKRRIYFHDIGFSRYFDSKNPLAQQQRARRVAEVPASAELIFKGPLKGNYEHVHCNYR
jgi:hypothetical protein